MSTTIDPTLARYLPTSLLDSIGTPGGPSKADAETIARGIQARVENMPPAEAETFLALVRGSDLAPTGGVSGQAYVDQVEGTLARLEGVASRVAELMNSTAGTIEFLIRAFIETTAEQRKEALESRLAARESAKDELFKQAGDMKEAAKKMMDGAITAIVFTVVMSAISLVGSAVSLGKGLGSAKDVRESLKGLDGLSGEDLTKAQSALKGLTDNAAVWGNIGTGAATAGQLGQGISSSATSITQSQAKEIEARGSISAAEAQNKQAEGDIKKEVQQAMDEMLKAIINFLKELRESEANHMQALTKV